MTGLTIDDVTALRGAEGVSFHYGREGSYMRPWLSSADGRIYTAIEQRKFPDVGFTGDRERRIEVAHEFTFYGRTMDDPVAYYGLHGAMFNRAWCTTVNMLRKGDELTLHWTADNNTITLENAGLHVDFLNLVVRNDRRRFDTFHVATTVTPNNTARMIRRKGDQ